MTMIQKKILIDFCLKLGTKLLTIRIQDPQCTSGGPSHWTATATHGFPWGDDRDVNLQSRTEPVNHKQRRGSRARWDAAQPAWVLLSALSPHTQTLTVFRSAVLAWPLYTGLSWLAPRSGTSSWTAQWGFLFILSPNFSKKNIQTMNYHSFICQTTSQTAVCFCRLLYLVHFTPILRC